MSRLLPEPLVTVRWFGTPEEAVEPQRRLEKAGVTSYIGGEFYRYRTPAELRVPESRVTEALQVLGIDPSEWAARPKETPAPVTPPCPDCHAHDSDPIPPYGWWALLGSIVALAALVAVGQAGVGLGAVVAGWLLATWFSRDSGKMRCRRCGRKWKP